ncbi:MAG: DNA polymerase III subunit delta' [Rubritepida sp.]|nr:DNA polymerase III subunit delta' [Rubritepida sp.]
MSGAGEGPRALPRVFGHGEAMATLERAARGGRLPHAWLFAGPPRVGKATVAWRFAAWLLAGQPPAPAGKGPLWLPTEAGSAGAAAVRRVIAGGHPDLLSVAPQAEPGRRRIIPVEALRAARQFLALTAAEGGYRVVLVDEAEGMEAASANALLKTLEEPPPRTVIILVTAAPGRLLPTLRSRCRRLDFFPLPAPELQGWIAEALPGLDAPARAELAALADGAPGQALELAEGEGVELARLAAETLAALPDAAGAHALADRIAGREAATAFRTFFTLLGRALTAAVRAAARGEPAPAWLGARPLAAWAEAAAAVERLVAETERLSLDRRQAVLGAIETLRGR